MCLCVCAGGAIGVVAADVFDGVFLYCSFSYEMH